MLVLVVIARENFDSGHFELFNFPGRLIQRPEFLAGMKPCDVFMRKVYWEFAFILTGSGFPINQMSGSTLRSIDK
jgi:hypothetical protein